MGKFHSSYIGMNVCGAPPMKMVRGRWHVCYSSVLSIIILATKRADNSECTLFVTHTHTHKQTIIELIRKPQSQS